MKKDRLVTFFLKKYSTILLYHRIANVVEDPHLMCVSPENFFNQLEYLKKNFNIIKLFDFVEKLKLGSLSKEDVCVTFDDGYADNFYNALPILTKLQIPATIFITAGKLDQTEPFFWDNNIRKEDQGRSLTKDEFFQMSKNSLIEIGSHSLTHSSLPLLNNQEQRKEIQQSKKILEEICGKPVNGFSYPFGTKIDFNKAIIDLVKNANYAYACSNIQSYVTNKDNIYALPRKLVRDWSLAEFKNCVLSRL